MNLLFNLAASLLLMSSVPGSDPCGGRAYVAFTCRVGFEELSVCRTAEGDRLTDFHYAPFGTLDLSVRAGSRTGHEEPRIGELLFAAGEVRYLRFGGHKLDYVVYSGEGRGWTQSGLIVLANGNHQLDAVCSGSAVLALNGLKDLPRDSEALARSIWWQVPISRK